MAAGDSQVWSCATSGCLSQSPVLVSIHPFWEHPGLLYSISSASSPVSLVNIPIAKKVKI